MSEYDLAGEDIVRHFQSEIAAIIEKRPALQTIVAPFGAVLIERAIIIEDLKNKINIDVFADNNAVYFYNAQYTKPMKDKNLYLNGVNKNGYMWVVYNILDVCCLVLPCRHCESLAKVAELMNK